MLRLSTCGVLAMLAIVFGLLTLHSPVFAQSAAPAASVAVPPPPADYNMNAGAQSPPSADDAKAGLRYCETKDINNGDEGWMETSTALVLLMTPGLALFYGGMVRSKNVLSVLMQSFVACGLITVQWAIYGYSIAFGPGVNGPMGGVIGNFSYLFLHHVSAWTPEGTINAAVSDSSAAHAGTSYSVTVSHQIYCMFQLMFAIITPALISGAIVERMKFSAYLLFMLLWATFVYDPLAHMVWSHDGWLNKAGALDFAGGSVVHMSSGFSALTLAIIIGRRKKSEGGEELRPHNLPMTAIGTALLWFGWFGFNAGSAVNASGLSVSAFTATHIATGTAALTWMMMDWIFYKKPTALGFCSGAVAGLVAITPACGFVAPMGALILGFAVSFICFFAIKLKHLLKADDALDVFGVHGIGGLIGCLGTGCLAVAAINSPAGGWTGHNGLFNGGSFTTSLLPQLKDAGTTILLAVVGTTILAFIVKLICGGLRAGDEEEDMGLDLTDHGETGYSSESAGGTALAPSFATAD